MQRKQLTTELQETEIVSGVTVGGVKKALEAIHAFQSIVRSQLKEGHDFGTIPGTPKPTLYKPGAEKIAKLLACADQYEVIKEVEDWDRPLFSYTIRCSLISINSGRTISTGLGECNSWEGKYRYRWVGKKEAEAQGHRVDGNNVIHLETGRPLVCKFRRSGSSSYPVYRVDNDDIFSIKNTILKMAKKRALVDASLSAGRLSDLFTQDLDEYKESGVDIGKEPEVTEPTGSGPKPGPAKKPGPKPAPVSAPKPEPEPENTATSIKQGRIEKFAEQLWGKDKFEAELDRCSKKNFKKDYKKLTEKNLDSLLEAIVKAVQNKK